MSTRYSAIDTERFGLRIARADAASLSELEAARQYGERERIRMMILRVDTRHTEVIHAAEAAGARLMDTVVTYCAPARAYADRESLRVAQPGEAHEASRLARRVFEGYANHYRSDPALAREDVEEIYPSWAASACSGSCEAAPVLFALDGGRVAGLAAVTHTPDGVSDVALFGIDPSAAGKGLGRRLLAQAVGTAFARGARTITYTTHLTNLPAQRMLCAAGFAPASSRHTFHLWWPA